MTHELLSEYCKPKELPESWVITRVETKAGKKSLVPTQIHRDRSDPYSEFVVREIEWLHDRINLMKAGGPSFKGHGLRRPQGEIRQMRQRWDQEVIPNYIYVINALCGKEDVTVKFFKRKGKLYRYNLELRNGSPSKS